MPHTAHANDPRFPALSGFLQRALPGDHTPPQLVSSDASARRYWRTRLKSGETRMVMDAPPPGENVVPFIDVQRRLAQSAVPVPSLFAQDTEQGFLLLEDLGDDTLFQWRHGQSPQRVDTKLAAAVELLPTLAASSTEHLPHFDAERLAREMDLFPEWYLGHYHQHPLSQGEIAQWQRLRDLVCHRLVTMPQVFVHRDYHSRNLMVRDEQLIVIDFQDAVSGPLPYDLVSLLRDSYIDWPVEQVLAMQQSFWARIPAEQRGGQSLADFQTDFAWVAVQRHLKVLGIFARLSFRDGKHGYLRDLPLTWRHVQWALAQIPELDGLSRFLAPFPPQNPTTDTRP